MAITDKALIVRLAVSQWTSRVFDKKLTDETAAANAIESGRVRAMKALVAKEAISKITAAASAIRLYTYKMSLPWDDGGGRLLPADLVLTYRKEYREMKDRFDSAVAEFIDGYPAYVDDARRALNGAFNERQYPTVERLKSKYKVTVVMEPLPLSSDFRVDINSAELSAIKKELETASKEREANLVNDLYERLYKVVKHAADTLSDPEKTFRDSLVENIIELTNFLPALNVTGNKHFEALRKGIVKELASAEPDTLRKDPETRKNVAESADALMAKMASYLGYTPGDENE